MKLIAQSPHRFRTRLKSRLFKAQSIQALLPGLLLTTLVAALALLIDGTSNLRLLNPLLTAVILGLVIRNTLGAPRRYQPGITFAMKRILRLAVILLGLKLSLAQVWDVGMTGLLVVVVSSVSTFCLTCWLGRKLHVNQRLTQLIAAGTSICGASAVVATNAVVESSEEDVAYAIALVTGFGTLAMLGYPLLLDLTQLSPSAFGLWCGASIHEVAQVVAASFQQSSLSGEIATITKLSRVLLIIPIVVTLSYQQPAARESTTGTSKGLPIPWFVLLFGVLVLGNSANLIPDAAKSVLLAGNQFLLCLSMAAMGLVTRFDSLTRIGLKPLYLAGLSWLFLGGLSLMLIQAAT